MKTIIKGSAIDAKVTQSDFEDSKEQFIMDCNDMRKPERFKEQIIFDCSDLRAPLIANTKRSK